MLRRFKQEVRTLLAEEEHPDTAADPRWRKFLRFWLRVSQEFTRNRCPIRASALAYSSLLAFVPLLAVVIGISTSLLKDREQQIRGWIDDVLANLAPQLLNNPDLARRRDEVVLQLQEMIGNVNSGTIGAAGTIALLGLILFMVARIEETMNDIWGVSQGRSWYARLVNYWTAISLGPIVIFAALAFSTTIRLEQTRTWLQGLPFGSFLLSLIPIPFLCGACAVLYAFMPNTRVLWRPALVGGAVAGVLWHLNNTLGVLFVAEATRYAKIYGPLSVVPVFMVGLYFFWVILLFGAQAAYTYQNRRSFLAARQVERVHQEGRELVALRVMVDVGQAFRRGNPPPSLVDLSNRLEVPSELVTRVTRILVQARLLAEAGHEEDEATFLPARPLAAIQVTDVLDAMRRGTGGPIATRADGGRAVTESALAEVAEAERKAGARTIEELVAAAEQSAGIRDERPAVTA